MTLEEILKGTVPGVKVTTLGAAEELWFQPVFKDINGIYYGTNQNGVGTFFNGDSKGWRLWVEPNKKIKRWLWTDARGDNLSCFLSEQEAADYNRESGAEAYTVRLPFSEMELEE